MTNADQKLMTGLCCRGNVESDCAAITEITVGWQKQRKVEQS